MYFRIIRTATNVCQFPEMSLDQKSFQLLNKTKASYFWKDKIHLNQHGTQKFLTNIDKVCKVKRSAVLDQKTVQAGRMQQGSRRGRGPPARRGPRSMSKLVITRMSVIIMEGTLECKVDSINRNSMGA